jgi:hypothetical protein
MITIRQIIEARDPNTHIHPLWKLRIKDSEYAELKVSLKDAVYRGTISLFEKEAALYYAEWWRREYSGGSPSTKSLVSNLGLSIRYSDDFYEAAKRGAKKLGIRVIQQNDRHFYFRTMLLQGGLPINYIRNNENGFNGYKRFLLGLVKEVKAIDIDWNNIDFIETLPCINYLPSSFNNEEIFDLSLQIAHAIVEGRDDLLPYDAEDGEWKNLTTELKQENSREKRRIPFMINWEMFKKERLTLYYSIDNTKKIDSHTIRRTSLSGCYSFSLYVQDKYVASYRRMNEDTDSEYCYLRIDNRSERFVWKGESVINIQLKGDNDNIADITAPRCFAPDFSSPQVFQKFEDKWLLKSNRKETNENAVLFTDEWQCEDRSFVVEKIQLNNNLLSWVEFKNSIALVNTETNEEAIFDNKVSTYFVEFMNWAVNWIQDANYKVLISNPDIRVYDSEHEIVNKRNYIIYYRKYKTSEWVYFKDFGLPTGLLEFKIALPDGKNETEKFYHLENLCCNYQNINSESGEILWKLEDGIISNYKEEGLLFQKKSDKHFLISREDRLKNFPETVQFKFQNYEMPSLNIKVASPFKGITLTNSNGLELLNGEIIALDSLYRFKIIVFGFDDVIAEILYQKTKTDHPEPVIIRERIKKGIHSLSLFDEQIQKMFQLYGFNSFDRSSCVRMYFGDGINRKYIEVRRFDLDSFMNNDGRIFITDSTPTNSVKFPFMSLHIDNDENLTVLNNQKYLARKDYFDDILFLPTEVSPDEIEIKKMVKNDGSFSLPENYMHKKIIVFSDYLAEEKIVPKFYDFGTNIDPNVEDRHSLSVKDIERQKKILLLENLYQGSIWRKVMKYFELVMKHQLPFRTLNCFSAIAQSPDLMVRMLFSLSLSFDKDEWVSGIIKFEKEFASAYHWINADFWNAEFEVLWDSIPEVLKNEICKVCTESQRIVMEATLNTNVEELICYALQGGLCKNIPTINRSDVQEMRSKIMGRAGNNTDLPKCQITDTEMFFNIEGANGYQVTCMLSPVKAAETLMGKSSELWKTEDDIMTIRRTINFYRSYQSDVYNKILLTVVKKINAQM